ncbi:hypothetical protein [Flavobacterium sp.]|jgi:hypothetical protein|uniref:hypothetical protein n=1 Tax=Flavobacterium sp. TaxID=239 RepID=UPI0037BF25B6
MKKKIELLIIAFLFSIAIAQSQNTKKTQTEFGWYDLENGIYVNSCSKGHSIVWWKSSGNNGMGQAQMSITENLINQEGILKTKEFNNLADQNLDFDYEVKGKIVFTENKIKYIKINSKTSFISDDGCIWLLKK